MINDKMTNLFRPNYQVCQLQRYIKNVNRSSMRCGRVTLEQYFRCPLSQSVSDSCWPRTDQCVARMGSL